MGGYIIPCYRQSLTQAGSKRLYQIIFFSKIVDKLHINRFFEIREKTNSLNKDFFTPSTRTLKCLSWRTRSSVTEKVNLTANIEKFRTQWSAGHLMNRWSEFITLGQIGPSHISCINIYTVSLNFFLET